ncbi:MAG TPA: hypothetical protein VMV20_08715 [Chitinophagaceae bacterium]|nr:hypothetical protein [Chitinophagaceae bacterium]
MIPCISGRVFRFSGIGVVVLLITFASLAGQTLSPGQRQNLQLHQDSLSVLAYQMINAPDEGGRVAACNAFVPGLIRALLIPGSFSFPFDSLKQISCLYPEDSSFRIFTWQLSWTQGDDVYFGAIQMRTRDGSLKLFPLLDYSQLTTHFQDTVTSNLRWMGALYYNVVETSYRGKKYYTLFGFNDNTPLSDRKILEPLTFQQGKPVFGAPLFHMGSGDENRFILQYKTDGNARLNYDPSLHQIVYDHLTSLTGEPQKKFTLVPDGTYEAFRWEYGRWQHISQAFGPAKRVSVPRPLEMKKDLSGKD